MSKEQLDNSVGQPKSSVQIHDTKEEDYASQSLSPTSISSSSSKLSSSPVVDAMLQTPRCAVDLTWKDLCVTVQVPYKSNSLFPNFSRRCRSKLVLNNVSGIARHGTLTAILGGSGAGKTTLLCALANRFCGDVRGDIRINGWPIDNNTLRMSAFIPQTNLFIETLTTKEHLQFMVALRYSNSSAQERSLRVNKLLREMGLQPNSRISSLSGGEKKRLIFASEIVTDPPLLMCDEVTSGLDSHTALTIVSLLKLLASRGRTIICSIHQPSSIVFSAFNHLILMAHGRVAFAGKSDEVQPFFERIGYPMPQNYNPADYYIQMLAESQHNFGEDGSAENRVQEICDRFATSPEAKNLATLIQQQNDPNFLSSYSTQFDDGYHRTTVLSSTWWVQIYWLTWRACIDSLRNPAVHYIRTIHKLMTSILIALCFAGVKLNLKGVQDIEGALFIFLCENNFPSCYAVLNVFPTEIPIFLHKQSSSLYRCDTYYLSKVVSLIPGFILEPFLFTSIAYWYIGLRPDIYTFLMTAVIIMTTANVACAYGCLLSVVFESVEKSMLAMMPLNQVIMISAGFYMNIRTIPIYINWVKYISWMMYSHEALTILQWDGITSIECEQRGKRDDLPYVKNGEQVISRFGFQLNNLSEDLSATAIMFCVLHLTGCVCLWLRSRSYNNRH